MSANDRAFQTRWLQPTKQKLARRKVYGFDVETCDNNKTVYLIGLYTDGVGKQWSFRDAPSFLSHLLNHSKLFRNAWIVASNLHFDFFALLWQDAELRKKFRFRTRGNSSDIMFAKTYIVDGSFQANRKKDDKRGYPITFVDTYNYDRASVEEMGKLIGIPKYSQPACVPENRRPKDESEWKAVEEYNLRDAEVSYRYFLFLQQGFEELGATMKITLAGTAMSLFKNKYLKGRYYRHETDILKQQMKGYYGGRTEVFERGDLRVCMQNLHCKKFNYYDVNSEYPTVMDNGIYPDPNSLRTTYKNNLEYIQAFEGMSQVDVHCPEMRYAVLPFRRDDGMILFPIGSFTGWYCHNELRRALELGYTIKKVHKTFYYTQTCRPFQLFVQDLYALRCEYKKTNDRREKIVKLLLNSLYGKFGQRFMDREMIIHGDAMTFEELSNNQFEPLAEGFFRLGNIESEPSPFCIPIWAAYITAYARLHLHRFMLLYNPIYVDTDSLMTHHTAMTSNALGDLKEEMTITEGYVVRSKFYGVAGNKGDKPIEYVKIKGLGIRFGYRAYFDLIKATATTQSTNHKKCDHIESEGFGKRSRLCKNCGTVLYDKFMKLKESLRRGFTPNEIIDVSKHLSLNDDKHHWDAPFDMDGWQRSTPLQIEAIVKESGVAPPLTIINPSPPDFVLDPTER